MTIRTHVIPDAGAKTPVPALEPLLFELARPGRNGRHLRSNETAEIPDEFKRKAPLRLPELTEPQVVRHYTHLAQLNYSVDTGMYPLGSCTMKYNPKVNDRVAGLFADVHPRQSYRTTQGVLALAYELEQMLAKITGMDFVSLQPQAGAQSEFTALLGVARPGDLGFDCVHINVHKTFSTPHGAGGPGAGPLCVKAHLRPFLPKPWIVREADGSYHYDTAREDRAPAGLGDSIGTIKQRLGNFGVLVRAYTYMKTLGEERLVETGRDAILSSNSLLALLRPAYDVAYERPPMHEFVISAAKQKKQGASALDISKALLDEGFHSPTVYFPLIVPEAMMIEPTETEPTETLDAFAAAMLRIAERVKTDPAAVRDAPRSTPLRRLDEVGAARKPVLRYRQPDLSQGENPLQPPSAARAEPVP